MTDYEHMSDAELHDVITAADPDTLPERLRAHDVLKQRDTERHLALDADPATRSEASADT